jgi:hypothetical protein
MFRLNVAPISILFVLFLPCAAQTPDVPRANAGLKELELSLISGKPREVAWTAYTHGYGQSLRWETKATARRKQSPGSGQTMRGHFALKNLHKLPVWQSLLFTTISGRSRQ